MPNRQEGQENLHTIAIQNRENQKNDRKIVTRTGELN
jgi:hypothetical protein